MTFDKVQISGDEGMGERMRTFDDYKDEVYQDAVERIRECDYEDFDECFDDLFLSVTGNDNGSYFCDARKARIACAGLEFDKDFLDALKWHFGNETLTTCLSDGPEAFDVLVRLVALEEMYGDVEHAYREQRHGLCAS